MSHKIFGMAVSAVYPHYIRKVEKKGRSQADLETVVSWLTGYDAAGLRRQLDAGTDFETFFAEAPAMNPDRRKITGMICGIRVEDIEDPLMQEIRYLDKLVDELGRGKKMQSILRS